MPAEQCHPIRLVQPGGGFFSGRFRRDNLDTLTECYDQLAVKVYCIEENFKRQDRAQELAPAKASPCPTSPLAYVYNQPEGIHALSGARTPEEVRVNVEATEIELTTENRLPGVEEADLS